MARKQISLEARQRVSLAVRHDGCVVELIDHSLLGHSEIGDRAHRFRPEVGGLPLRLLLALVLLALAMLTLVVPVNGEDVVDEPPSSGRPNLHEPVYRVSKAPVDPSSSDSGSLDSRRDFDRAGHREAAATRNDSTHSDSMRAANSDPARRADSNDRLAAHNAESSLVAREVADAHPLDPGLAMARAALAHIEREITDYTCTMVKRERVDGELLDHEFMTCKIRHERGSTPFSVYLGYRKPDTIRGREVLYVSNRNEGKLTAHEGGLKGRFIPTVHLLPTSALAMRGNRYPITEIGIETLTRRLIEKGERDRKLGLCNVRLVDGTKVDGRVCTMLQVKHSEHNEAHDFHLARVFMDKELNVPIRYEAYGWPVNGGKPPLLEEYTYVNLKLNVGLTNEDFDAENSSYRF